MNMKYNFLKIIIVIIIIWFHIYYLFKYFLKKILYNQSQNAHAFPLLLLLFSLVKETQFELSDGHFTVPKQAVKDGIPG